MTRVLTFVVSVLTATAAWACPLCKDAIPSSDAQAPGGVPGGFNTTIYLMLGSLFCVIAMISMTRIRGARGNAIARARSPIARAARPNERAARPIDRAPAGYRNAAKFDRIPNPTFWLFSGWNCVAITLSRQMLLTTGRP